MHANFSYQKFNHTYNAYQKEIIALGMFIQEYRDIKSTLSARIKDDILKIKNFRKEHGLDQN